ncbi:MAG: hypothetical protein NTW28_12445 [Candidatus Solibacter sp.]|nr:hypothetical protein [Candidatus Solibacter sp.]
MSLELKPKKWAGAVREVTLGAGSRRALTVGGGNGLPLHTFEATFPHRALGGVCPRAVGRRTGPARGGRQTGG